VLCDVNRDVKLEVIFHASCVAILTYLLTYLLTPWCRVSFEKLIVTQLFKKSFLYGTQRFITVRIKAHQWNLS
jgi:hypothetical protein